MKKCLELSNALTEQYLAIRQQKKIPELKLQISQGDPEGFSSKYAAGVLSIDAANCFGHVNGIAQMATAVKAGHLADYLGKSTPKFQSRILWFGAEREVQISELVTIHLPTFMLDPDLTKWLPLTACRLTELGFNTIILGCRKNSYVSNAGPEKVDLQRIIKDFELYGIKVILKPNFLLDKVIKCPLDDNFCALLTNAFSQIYSSIPSCSAIFWESMLQSPRYRFHPKANELTLVDILIEEVHLLEKCCGLKSKKNENQLIFYLPVITGKEGKGQAMWIPTLLDEMGDQTVFAFSAVEGDFCHDHLPNHPLWQELRRSPDSSATPLLPIINFGAVEQGEGLWPATNLDLIDRFLPRCRRHNFSGVIGLVNHLPKEGSFLDCLLWVAGQSLWRDLPSSLLAETWYEAHREEQDFVNVAMALKAVRNIVLEFSFLRTLENNEERRRIGEPLAALLKIPTHFFEKKNWAFNRPSLKEYFDLFACDTKRFLEHSLQLSCRTTFGGALGGEESQPSFWTNPNGRGDFLSKPQEGLPGTPMETIYKENRLL